MRLLSPALSSLFEKGEKMRLRAQSKSSAAHNWSATGGHLSFWEATSPDNKLQIPNPKLQRSAKHQPARLCHRIYFGFGV
jgi:hypothetical protein